MAAASIPDFAVSLIKTGRLQELSCSCHLIFNHLGSMAVMISLRHLLDHIMLLVLLLPLIVAGLLAFGWETLSGNLTSTAEERKAKKSGLILPPKNLRKA